MYSLCKNCRTETRIVIYHWTATHHKNDFRKLQWTWWKMAQYVLEVISQQNKTKLECFTKYSTIHAQYIRLYRRWNPDTEPDANSNETASQLPVDKQLKNFQVAHKLSLVNLSKNNLRFLFLLIFNGKRSVF